MSVDDLGIHLGPLYIRFYALALLAGILAAAALIAYRTRRYGHDPERLWDGLIWVVIAGIVGARIYHVLTPPPSMGITPLEYIKRPLDAIDTRQGGLGLPGALIGGALAVFFYTRYHKLNFLVWADLAIPGVALGQAVGRLGNFFNQELYGKPTDLPWAVTIKPQYRLAEYADYARFHPMFLYEMIWNLLICGGLMWVHRRFTERVKPGDLLALYLIFYFGGRFFLEFIKLDAPVFGQGLTIAQVVSVLSVAGGLTFLAVRHRRADKAPETSPETD
ncbi:MAG: prolipoprotein diacylglyceryl transferase [Anaerolineae bacterium]|jgi:phosphatidylglycerol:prolipoprotein diacylglycerol transferase